MAVISLKILIRAYIWKFAHNRPEFAHIIVNSRISGQFSRIFQCNPKKHSTNEVDSLKTSVVEKDYLNLHENIMKLQEKWKESLPVDAVVPKWDPAAVEAGVPVAALTNFHFDISLFLQWLEEVSELLISANEELADKLAKARVVLTEDVAKRWMEEAFAFNHAYFQEFSEANGLEEWISPFLAETVLRPYLLRTAEIVQEKVHHAVHGNGCPVCGEPPRLAALEEDGKKMVHCPRCLAHWHAKRLECSHCGNENHETIQFITIEGDSVNQIQVCDECNGYIKVIDIRQYIEKPQAGLMDLNTLHLDFVAQEQGYQAVGTRKEKN
jgi:FdhE protein